MNLLFPECAGASLHKYEKCPRCGATRQENCLDDAAYKALLIRRNGTVPIGPQSCPTPGACSATAIIDYQAAEIARLRAELAAAEAAAWQPIATAPRGTTILVSVRHNAGRQFVLCAFYPAVYDTGKRGLGGILRRKGRILYAGRLV